MHNGIVALPPLLLVATMCSAFRADAREIPASKWDLVALYRAPRTYEAPGFEEPGVRALFFDGLSFQGRPTRVFAWVGVPEHAPGAKVPGMVLVHGGGGTAFAEWVRRWTARGYAAIAMDLNGEEPRGTYNHWMRHEWAGPAGSASPGNAGFDQIDWPLTDQWCYHAVADIVLAHSLLRSLPEVDTKRIGVTGISWGGFLTCLVSGVDTRFRLAAPVYGCGFLGDDSAWASAFQAMGEARAQRWLTAWDPSVYLPHARMPMLWLNGTNDFAYPLSSFQRSYRLPRSARTVVIRVRMVHNHGPLSEGAEEIRVFADSIFHRGAPGLTKIVRQGRRGRDAWVEFRCVEPLSRAELVYTCDEGAWQSREWRTAPASIDRNARRVSAVLPEGVLVYFFNLIDSRPCIVSSEHVLIKGEGAPSRLRGPRAAVRDASPAGQNR